MKVPEQRLNEVIRKKVLPEDNILNEDQYVLLESVLETTNKPTTKSDFVDVCLGQPTRIGYSRGIYFEHLRDPYLQLRFLRNQLFHTQRQVRRYKQIIDSHEDRISFLEDQNKKRERQRIEEVSKNNMKFLSSILEMSPVEVKEDEDVFAEMSGMFSDLSEEGLDATELLRSVRDE